MTISLIIPTLNAEPYIKNQLLLLQQQTVIPDEIIIVDSESDDNTVSICHSFSDIKVLSVHRKDFDHGKTRDMALKQSKGDIVIFMTQDAIPADNYSIEHLIQPLIKDNTIAVVSGRQLARRDANYAERLIRQFNYPDQSSIRTKEDIDAYGIKTFFSSDVFAAYNREIYLKLGGFDYPIKTNEDMFFAAKAIQNGYKVVYKADACVIHSHHFTLKQQYKRNYIEGYEIEKHKDLLANVPMTSEGVKLAEYVSKDLLKHGHGLSFIQFVADCGARYLGNKAGRKEAEKN